MLFFHAVHIPPHITGLRERRRLDDLRRHPSVGSRCRHPSGPAGFTGQAEVSDLERLEQEVVSLTNVFQDED